jgi:hypothetical protein
MTKSIRGVYQNLEDSTYIASNGDMYLFFSSSSRLGKFLVGYVENRLKLDKKIKSSIGDMTFPFEFIADIQFYNHCENKGHLCLIGGKKADDTDMEAYISKLIADREPLEYRVVSDLEEIEKVRSYING